MKEQNKLIGEFLYPDMLDIERIKEEGIEIDGSSYAKMQVYLDRHDDSQYHKSWNWLMLAVSKCTRVSADSLISDITDEYDNQFEESHTYFITNDIKSVYECVVEFIKYYNKKKNEKN